MAVQHRASAAAPTTAAPYLPEERSIAALREAVQGCRGCELYRKATQAVFGEGPRGSTMVIVGEQPGDEEDRAGSPFVGPAGRLLDRALADAGIARRKVWVTNAVKHFKWEPRGKRRIHAKPNPNEVRACAPWLDAEIDAIEPEVVVALGVTAARAVFGRSLTITASRGRALETRWQTTGLVTIHPSAVLRAPDPEARERTYADLVSDLRVAARLLREGTPRDAASTAAGPHVPTAATRRSGRRSPQGRRPAA